MNDTSKCLPKEYHKFVKGINVLDSKPIMEGVRKMVEENDIQEKKNIIEQEKALYEFKIAEANELMDKIKEHEQQLAMQEKKRWRAEDRGTYYYINSFGSIACTFDSGEGESDWNYKSGNYFRTTEQAEAYRQAIIDVRDRECEITSGCRKDDGVWYVKALYIVKNKEEMETLQDKLKVLKGE